MFDTRDSAIEWVDDRLLVSGLAEQQLSGDQRPSKVVNNKGAVVGPFVVLSDGV